MSRRNSSPSSALLLIALTLGAVGFGIYVTVLIAEGNNSLRQVAPHASAILAGIGASVMALLGRGQVRIVAAGVAATLFTVVGLLTIASIGLIPLGAGACCVAWLIRSSEADRVRG